MPDVVAVCNVNGVSTFGPYTLIVSNKRSKYDMTYELKDTIRYILEKASELLEFRGVGVHPLAGIHGAFG